MPLVPDGKHVLCTECGYHLSHIEIAYGTHQCPPMAKDEYEAKKTELKQKRKEAGDHLHEVRCSRTSTQAEYAEAVRRYVAAQDALEANYRQQGGPQPTRAERRIAKLRAKGIRPAWG